MSAGQSRRSCDARDMSGILPTPDLFLRRHESSKWANNISVGRTTQAMPNFDLAQHAIPGRAHLELMDSQHTSPELPLCPECDKTMILAKTWPRLGGLPQLNTFECKDCSIVFTEVVTGE